MVEIRIATANAYCAVIGENILAEASEYIPDGYGKAVIIWDERIPADKVALLGKELEKTGKQVLALSVESGEELKTIAGFEKLIKAVADFKLTRDDAIYSVGGGTVGDVAGFIASVYKRGISLVMVPTTVLSACDSSIGGKNALNLGNIKNLIGTFYQPSLVLVDTEFFPGLGDETFREGCAEVIKYGFIGDKDLIRLLDERPLTDNKEDLLYIENILRRCIKIKADFVASDEYDRGERMLLNFGHTFAHAIESESGFKIHHGKAVAMGMALITRACEAKGLCEEGTYELLLELLERHNIEWRCPYDVNVLLSRLVEDKKVTGDSINIVIPKEIGKCVVNKIKLDELKDLFDDSQSKQPGA